MNTPPASSPAARRRFAWGTGAGLFVVLLCAARVRFLWPAIPTADADTWGYLHPALSKLNGQGFVHTNGRNFVYPAWLYLLLAGTGDFRAIPAAQHVLGLASGGLMWVCWRQWRGWFAEGRLPAWADAALGLGLVAFFEQSASVVNYEHQIRPEAIFPFFALLDVCLLLAFLRAWFVTRRTGRAAALAGGGVFVALLLYQLKPSFGLALGVAAAPLLVAALVPWRQPGRPRWTLAGAAAGSVAAGLLLFVWPEHRLARGDAMSVLFLPETLLTVHANVIADQMNEDVRGHAATPFAFLWLAQSNANLRLELGRASDPARHPYPTLGFNPDHLMYQGRSYCAWLNARLPPPQVAAFAFYYYQRAWTHRPGAMLAKVWRQVRAFYSLHCTTFWPGDSLRIDKLYRKSIDAFGYPNYQRELALYPPARAYLAEARRLAAADIVFPQWGSMVWANVVASVVAMPLMGLSLAGLSAAGLARAERFHAPAVARLLTPGWVLLWFYGFVFGNVLTISFAHSVDVDRYCLNLVVFYAPALAGTLAWTAELALAWFPRREAAPAAAKVPGTMVAAD